MKKPAASPAAGAAAAAAEASGPDLDDQSPSTSSQQVHVLAVDDSLIDRTVIERLLKTSSYKVTSVDSALRALEILGIVEGQYSPAAEGIQINMIITDYCMPQMTGYDLLKRVKGVSSLKEIPVVIMSSENVEQRITSCFEEGAEDFIIKPVKLADMKRISSYLRKKDCSSNNSGEAFSSACSSTSSDGGTGSKKRKRVFQQDASQRMRLTVQ